MSDVPHPSLLRRKIIHVDMDAFYAMIEVRDRPELKGKPLVVGGPPNSRSVVCTASYEARRYGIRSAMPCSRAARLCPEVIFLPPRFDAYRDASRQIRAIFRDYTPLVEPLSLDEAYLDVTTNSRGMYAVAVAAEIKRRIRETLGLTCSAGVAPNKMIAKIASDLHKPDGLTVVLPVQARSFMRDLPVRKINGIGPVTERRLAAVGIVRCRDVLAWDEAALEERLGDLGHWLAEAARGIDERPVDPTWERRSLGREETYAQDLVDLAAIRTEVEALARSVAGSLARRSLKGRTIVLKVKYADFTQITRSQTVADATDDPPTIARVAAGLLEKTAAGRMPLRLLGVTVGKLEGATATSVDDDDEDDEEAKGDGALAPDLGNPATLPTIATPS